MADDPGKITVYLKEKEYEIDKINDFQILNNKIISLLEEIYDKDLTKVNNLYKIYYIDEDNDRTYVKTLEDFKYFINTSSTLYLEANENEINKIKIEKLSNNSNSDNELKLLEKIEELTRINENLKKEKDLYSEMSQIYLEKINILQENEKLKNEKEISILKALENEKKEKSEIINQLEEEKKLNESMSLIINKNSNNDISIDQNIIINNNSKDILVNNLQEEKNMLKNQLNEERKKIDFIEKIYSEDNNKLKQRINNLQNEFDSERQNILKNNDILIKKEVEKGINDYINKSRINLERKENEINKIKNDYENKINTIREECYQEIEEKYSKIYEEKIKQIYESAMNNSKMFCDNIVSKNQQQFEEEEKKRNQLINSSLLFKANDNNNSNLSRLSQCKTMHNNIRCNECKIYPIIGYRYKCLECPDYNLCEGCEKIVNHEHNFVKYVSEEKNFTNVNDDKYSYECLTSKLIVSIYEGSQQAKLVIILKNNGNLAWTNQTLLINAKNSQIKCNYIKLKPLKPKEQYMIEITFDNLVNLPANNYSSIFLFTVDEKIYGMPLKIIVNILKH